VLLGVVAVVADVAVVAVVVAAVAVAVVVVAVDAGHNDRQDLSPSPTPRTCISVDLPLLFLPTTA
jgi:hypothetical protein